MAVHAAGGIAAFDDLRAVAGAASFASGSRSSPTHRCPPAAALLTALLHARATRRTLPRRWTTIRAARTRRCSWRPRATRLLAPAAPRGAARPGDYLELGPDIGLFTREALERSRRWTNSGWSNRTRRFIPRSRRNCGGTRPHAVLGDMREIAANPGRIALACRRDPRARPPLLEPQPLLEQVVRKLARRLPSSP